jgi:uncharacterized protein (DUF427 family)
MGTGRRWSPVRPEPVRPGQESVWDYPRPPRLETDPRLIEIRIREADGSAGALLASSSRSWRVLETSHPPVFYIPRDDVLPGVLRAAGGGSVCEFKGPAAYWDVLGPDGALLATTGAWSYERPWAGYEALAGALAFYPAPFMCTVAGEIVRPQPGGFYGGWITDDVAGPFKGAPGTLGW